MSMRWRPSATGLPTLISNGLIAELVGGTAGSWHRLFSCLLSPDERLLLLDLSPLATSPTLVLELPLVLWFPPSLGMGSPRGSPLPAGTVRCSAASDPLRPLPGQWTSLWSPAEVCGTFLVRLPFKSLTLVEPFKTLFYHSVLFKFFTSK
jgi:hypothetical protein